MNMSYCRFHNTRIALQDCVGAVMEHVNAEAEYEVSDEEIRTFRQMVHMMHEFLAYDICVLNEDGEIDEEQLENVCEAMSRGYHETFDEINW